MTASAEDTEEDVGFHIYPGMRRPPARDQVPTSITQRIVVDLASYGATDDASMIGALRVLYREWMEETSAETRMAVLNDFIAIVDDGRISSNVLLPFIGCDNERGIASSAALGFAMLHPSTADQAMLGVVLLAKGITGGTMNNPGAVFGGLLNLGDYRVNKVLWPIRDRLVGPDLDAAVRVRTGRLSAAVVDFLLDWMEQMPAAQRESRFNPLAAALVNHRSAGMVPLVARGGRIWPVREATPEQEDEAADYVALAWFARSILPRLEALREIAPEPDVIDYVIQAWEGDE